MRIAVTSDLHYDTRGYLTKPEIVHGLAGAIRASRPDAVILAGDIAHGLDEFERCIACFDGAGVPVGVLCGNHDVWHDPVGRFTSHQLFFGGELERVARAHGAHWLESESMCFGRVAIVGTMAWYDYSAIDPVHTAPPEMIAALKKRLNNDAAWVDWGFDDRSVAEILGARFLERLKIVAADASVERICVVTHVPVLEEQIVRKPDDADWGFSNAYFGNLTLGKKVLEEPKVRAVASGHTHCGRDVVVRGAGGDAIRAVVIDSDYGAPSFQVIEI